jgi:hypothetical protein
MTVDRLTPTQRDESRLFLGAGCGWGLGMAAPADDAGDAPLPCGFGWDGGTGTTWRSNRRTGATGILFTQRAAVSPEPSDLILDFWAGANAATAG